LSYGARLRVSEGDDIKRGDRIAEWEPYAIPILTELGGVVEFEDLVDGVSMVEVVDEATGISQREVIDASSQSRGADLKPAIVVKDEDGKIKTLSNGNEVCTRVIRLRVFRPKARHQAILPVVCRGLLNCLKHVVQKITPLSRKRQGGLNLAVTTKTNVV
jgi:hypothetical protein